MFFVASLDIVGAAGASSRVARNKSLVRRTPLVKFLGEPFGKRGSRMALWQAAHLLDAPGGDARKS